ncbi:hypothetical protein Tco_0615847 [Tanacetum coccineum]
MDLERHSYNVILNDDEKKRYDAGCWCNHIVLQAYPKTFLQAHQSVCVIEAKAIWDNVKMLLAGSELTKEDRESQLYDEFKRFRMLPGENINEYYVLFHKLVNYMRNIMMTMPNIQLNFKFVNNMSPEWDMFVTAVKLNKVLKETNHEQLYAYLKQHKNHAAQDRLIIERITPSTNDTLAFVSSKVYLDQFSLMKVLEKEIVASLFNDKMTSVHISSGLTLQRYLFKNCYFNRYTSCNGDSDSDTPSTSTSQTTQEDQSYVIPTSVEEDDHGIEVAHMDNDLPISTSSTNSKRSLFCYYDALLSSSEHKSYKDALPESYWIDAMKSFTSLNIWRFES